MQRVTREQPCRVCGKPDWCLSARDGTAVICARIEDGSTKRAGDAGWLHILDDRLSALPVDRWIPPVPSKRSNRDWCSYHERFLEAGCDQLNDLAIQLSVSRTSLERLGAGYDPARRWWTFPERDASGQIIGLIGRNDTGRKRRYGGAKCGLCYPADWAAGTSPVLLVEGASDMAAVLTMGLTGVARPSNVGGIALLTDLLSELPVDRPIVVIGERDKKEDDTWPGKAGAISTATQLATALEREVEWSLPPDNAKDTRAWLQSVSAISSDRWGALYLDGLDPVPVRPPVRYAYRPPAEETVDLDNWRQAMLEARIASLGVPGYYLDASPTGAGKSHIELSLVQHVLRGRRS